jgi:hypothetical protein
MGDRPRRLRATRVVRPATGLPARERAEPPRKRQRSVL